jgi:mycothiol synthase
MDELIIEVHQALDETQFTKIQTLLNSCAETDGLIPFSEHAILHMQYGHETEVEHLLCSQSGKLVGYAHVDLSDPIYGPSMEVAVLPDFRRHGVGKKLIEKIVTTHVSRPIRLWAHGLNTGASSLAASCGFKQVRTLWQMRRSLMTPIPPAFFPANLEIRTFNPDTDLDAWLRCNQKAFAEHPEQGQWSKANFLQRTSESWFDPNGLKVAISESDIVGYGWTKVDDANADSKLGEIYIVGISPEWQKKGLGKAFTIDGLRYLRKLNLNTALLYVDVENKNAIALYESLGFSHWDTDTLFQLD